MSFRSLVLLGLAVACHQEAQALGPSAPPLGEVVRAGFCIQRNPTRYAQPQSTSGYATAGPLILTEAATEIPLRKGVAFGFIWQARNLPNRAVVTYRVDHPLITRPDGVTLDHFEEDLEKETHGGSTESIDCYMLSEDHELIPGTWTLSIFFRGSLLATKSFQVYVPKP